MLQSECQVLNGMTLYEYINYFWKLEQEKCKNLKKIKTVLHSCSSHFIKNSRSKIKELFPDPKKHIQQRRIGTKIMAELVHCESVESANEIFSFFVKIFCSEYEPVSILTEISTVEATCKTNDSPPVNEDPKSSGKTESDAKIDEILEFIDLEKGVMKSSYIINIL